MSAAFLSSASSTMRRARSSATRSVAGGRPLAARHAVGGRSRQHRGVEGVHLGRAGFHGLGVGADGRGVGHDRAVLLESWYRAWSPIYVATASGTRYRSERPAAARARSSEARQAQARSVEEHDLAGDARELALEEVGRGLRIAVARGHDEGRQGETPSGSRQVGSSTNGFGRQDQREPVAMAVRRAAVTQVTQGVDGVGRPTAIELHPARGERGIAGDRRPGPWPGGARRP